VIIKEIEKQFSEVPGVMTTKCSQVGEQEYEVNLFYSGSINPDHIAKTLQKAGNPFIRLNLNLHKVTQTMRVGREDNNRRVI
jgi:copper chaperone CopZ